MLLCNGIDVATILEVLDVINNKDEFKDAFNRIESFTIRKNVHRIVSFSLIFVDNDGKLFLKKLFVGRIGRGVKGLKVFTHLTSKREVCLTFNAHLCR